MLIWQTEIIKALNSNYEVMSLSCERFFYFALPESGGVSCLTRVTFESGHTFYSTDAETAARAGGMQYIFIQKKKKNRIFLKYCNRWHNTAWFNTHRTVTSFWFISQVFLFCYITHIILLMCYICDTNVNRSWSWTDPAWSTQQRHTQSEVNKPKSCT